MSNKPQITETEAREILAANRVGDKVALIGIRGYYLDSIGKSGQNDRNVYDDAIIIVAPERYETFRANTDPSVYRKGIATMKTGVHRYYKGKHKNRYWALRLVGERVEVTRDGQDGTLIGVALNIHKGGTRTTGSLGCQTLAPADWDDFIEIVYDEMKLAGQKTIPYVLIDEKARRSGAFKMPHLDLNLSDGDIDHLINRIDETEPTAQVSKPTEQPATFSAPNQPMPDSDSQPQNQDAPAMQSAQNNSSGEACAVGTRPTDDAIQVSQGGFLSRMLTGVGGVAGAIAAAKGYASDNTILIAVGVVCATALILALIFRQVILDWLRMQIAASPDRYNVK